MIKLLYCHDSFSKQTSQNKNVIPVLRFCCASDKAYYKGMEAIVIACKKKTPDIAESDIKLTLNQLQKDGCIVLSVQ